MDNLIKFGDLIIFTDIIQLDKYKNRKFRFIMIDGDDYLLFDKKENKLKKVSVNFIVRFTKTKTKKRKRVTWELSSEI